MKLLNYTQMYYNYLLYNQLISFTLLNNINYNKTSSGFN